MGLLSLGTLEMGGIFNFMGIGQEHLLVTVPTNKHDDILTTAKLNEHGNT